MLHNMSKDGMSKDVAYACYAESGCKFDRSLPVKTKYCCNSEWIDYLFAHIYTQTNYPKTH